MSDLEYDVLDELYFLLQYAELSKELGMSDDELRPILSKLLKKNWLRCYSEPDVEVEPTNIDLEISFRKYYYLASKEGMKAHNG